MLWDTLADLTHPITYSLRSILIDPILLGLALDIV
jgi:hypothetical protein